MGAARNIGKGFIDGDPLDKGGEIANYLDGGIAQSLVLLKMSANKNEVRAEFARSPPRHPATNPEGLGFIGCGKHNSAPDSDRLATQRWI
jgi:hypothetical protein